MSIITALIGSIQGGSTPPPSPTYDASWSGSLDEGSSASLNVTVNNFPGGRIYWTIEGYGGQPIDLSNDIENTSGPTSGFYDFGNVTYASQSVTTMYWKADSLTEGYEYFYVKLGTNPGGTEYGTYGPWAINDTSTGPTYSFGSQDSSVNEGSNAQFVVNTTNVTDGTTLYWSVSNVTTDGSDFGSLTGSFTITSNSGSFNVPVSADLTTEGTEYFSVQVRTSSTTGTVVLTSNQVTINDTSTTPVPASFDLVNPPSNINGLPWLDSNSGVSATVVGGWIAPSDHGGAVGLMGTGYIEVSYINTSSNFTLSFAADFNPTGGSWNSLYSGGTYGSATAFSYLQPGGYINVGSGGNLGQTRDTSMSGIAWWDFVNDSTGSGNVKVYKNGTLIFTSPTAASGGFGSNMWIGQRHGSSTDYLYGNIYRIKYTQTVLDQTAITNQYDSVKSTYGLS